MTRDGFTLSYRRVDPQAGGYREVKTIAVGDLIAAAAQGYEPTTAACDELGKPSGTIDDASSTCRTNFAERPVHRTR